MADPATVTVKVSYQSVEREVKVAVGGTVGELKASVAEATGLPVALQKLLKSGIQLKDDSAALEKLKIGNKTKLLLIGTDLQTVMQVNAVPAGGATSGGGSGAFDDEKPTPLCDQPQHIKILEKGPPEEAEKPDTTRHEMLAGQSISGILNNRGTKVRLNFRGESSELIIATAGATNKIPYASVRKVESEEIKGHAGYHIVVLHLGVGEASRMFLYWVPHQYLRAIKGSLTGNWFF